ncbi:MAG: hypothetical protein KIS77_20725 [Saprospiraceae bacterium]|nr:hypothetical protein [Saprospiraceae bacterium]
MRKQVLFLCSLIAFIGIALNANAQARTDVRDFVAAAKETGEQLERLLPSMQKDRKATAYVPIIESAIRLSARVQQAGAGMSQKQYNGFQRELAKIEADLNTQTTQEQTPHTCHGKCEADFPGKGGGKGWKRFWCKVACIKLGPISGQ